MPTITGRTSQARTRLLRTASEIFYAEGIHDIGVDRILDQAAVTRSTFYRHFPSKEDLVLAYIQATDLAVRETLEQVGGSDLEPRALLRTLSGLMGDQICRPGFRGCAFINAAAEYPDPASPVHRAVLEHRAWLSGTVADALRRAGHADPDRATRHFMMLRDGAMVAGYLHDPQQARETLELGVEGLLSEGS
jgi:AcrR family transcriptional regulator